MDNSGTFGNGYGPAPERGTRRRKLAGYLKAANELRQSYSRQRDSEGETYGSGIPGAFPDASIARSGDEEMILFPSYALQHSKIEKSTHQTLPGASDDMLENEDGGDAAYWQKEWDKYEDENAVVDVDVRGWIYSPHRGPMTRKNRLLISLARHLSGIPAPSSSSQPNSRATSRHSISRNPFESSTTQQEDDLVEKEAQAITRRGRREADVAGRGGYSEDPSSNFDRDNLLDGAHDSRSSSPASFGDPQPGQIPRPLTNTSLNSEKEYSAQTSASGKRASWSHPGEMSSDELSVANAHLMARLQPFLTNPVVGYPLTVFFYNEKTSRSRTIRTNESGHFSLRAALDFIPTDVRVLASERLSATAEVRITEATGVSLISDIDDTIKHSAIGGGARETFRCTFIRPLSDLTIQGVREWYSKMAEMDVKLHYVSNAPWQLYPVLVSFFSGAGLPQGSFHLKKYSGMLQGIFEPVAERKKATLDRIIRDFPQRQFILVGDSGEADLELYTDIAVANPGRVLGVFIRDVTTPQTRGFFDSSMGQVRGRGSRSPLRGWRTPNGNTPPKKLATSLEQKPELPPRRSTQDSRTSSISEGPAMGTLVDLDEPEELSRPMANTSVSDLEKAARKISTKSSPPDRPSKPIALRSRSSESMPGMSTHVTREPSRKGPAPPPKPRKYSSAHHEPKSEPSPLSQTQSLSSSVDAPPLPARQDYRSSIANKVSTAYNSLPSASAYWNGTSQYPESSSRSGSDTGHAASTSGSARPPPPVPPRRNVSSYPAAAAQYASNRLNNAWNGGVIDTGTGDLSSNQRSQMSKKEDLWRRRWARAREVLEDEGVMLRSWRIGEDVMDDAVRLVKRAART
ncbi:hypothetical protein MMC20_006914 [Loxospora ochrophaea]|nr:hypothetical protein [Loxospora ochrophaea]